jgi:hypothetical protein
MMKFSRLNDAGHARTFGEENAARKAALCRQDFGERRDLVGK